MLASHLIVLPPDLSLTNVNGYFLRSKAAYHSENYRQLKRGGMAINDAVIKVKKEADDHHLHEELLLVIKSQAAAALKKSERQEEEAAKHSKLERVMREKDMLSNHQYLF